MIIRGNTVTTNMPRSDYSQTDPAKADFIRNKPDAAIAKAQATADEAKAAAKTAQDSSLPRAGGTMTGNIAMGGNTVTGLKLPAGNSDAASKEYVDTKTVAVTLLASGWVGGTAPYTQTVTVSGLTDDHRAEAHPVYTGVLATDLALKEACAAVSYSKRDGSRVTFTCLEEKPEVDISVEVEVYR